MFARFPLTILLLAAILLVTTARADCNCANSWSVDNVCYCGKDGAAIDACVKGIAPYWPFQNNTLRADSSLCPDPAVDAVAFDKCLEDSLPKSLPNAGAIASGCVASTKATPASSSASPASPASPGSPGTSKSGTLRNIASMGLTATMAFFLAVALAMY
ncbi:hypothetical protein DFJ77DRAFT_478469 [Powellomyces hirtus]|nr:hypothetical protein DFJ77DRAFT_478469 [Powellomyces hirtus]